MNSFKDKGTELHEQTEQKRELTEEEIFDRELAEQVRKRAKSEVLWMKLRERLRVKDDKRGL